MPCDQPDQDQIIVVTVDGYGFMGYLIKYDEDAKGVRTNGFISKYDAASGKGVRINCSGQRHRAIRMDQNRAAVVLAFLRKCEEDPRVHYNIVPAA